MVARFSIVEAARTRIERPLLELYDAPGSSRPIDYLEPAGDSGLFGPASVTWRVHRNPATMFIGGIAAVFLELAEPRIRSGVWDHTDFRTDPVARMRRTGMAAMITSYGSTKDVEATTAHVRRMHERVCGTTPPPDARPYRATDPELLRWVHATAAYGFLNAYHRYADPSLARDDRDRYYAESTRGAEAYGASDVPSSVDELERHFAAVRPSLRNHEILEEFRRLVSTSPVLGSAGLPLQRVLVEAAIDVLPGWAVELLDLEGGQWLRIARRPLVRSIVALLARVVRDGPAERACRRMGVSTAVLS